MVPAPVRLARPTPATAMRFVLRASASMISEGDPDDLPNLIACDPAILIDIHEALLRHSRHAQLRDRRIPVWTSAPCI